MQYRADLTQRGQAHHEEAASGALLLGTGHWKYVTAMAKAGIAFGADGLMIEVHMRPDIAFSDGIQPLKPAMFRQLMQEIAPFVHATGRRL
jgi:3-deoxy-7-phosphoheptulonate synthase